MWVRSSNAFYGIFNLHMDRSPGFGSAHTDFVALLRLGLPAAPELNSLTSPVCTTRRTVLQKVRRCTWTLFATNFRLFGAPENHSQTSLCSLCFVFSGQPKLCSLQLAHLCRFSLPAALLMQAWQCCLQRKFAPNNVHNASTVCKHRVSGSLSLPSRGPFHLSFTVLCAIGH